MQSSVPTPPGRGPWHTSLAARIALGFAVLLALLAALLAFFPWDTLRGPLNRHVSSQTGRHFEITRALDVKLGLTTTVMADGLIFANPEWAKDGYLVKAESAQISVKLLPLLRGRIELPQVVLHKPTLGLQLEPDGRRTWALGRDTSDESNFPAIGSLLVDEGALHFIAMGQGADIRADFAIDTQANQAMPLAYKATGTWRKQAFTAQGRTGSVLQLAQDSQARFPMEVRATVGSTRLVATGTVASMASLDGVDATFTLQGKSLADLYHLVGVVLPETPRYALSGHVRTDARVWRVTSINGHLGLSDLTGELTYDKSTAVPALSGKLQSKALDFDDLAPLVGLAEQPRSAAAPAVAAVAGAPTQRPATPRGAVQKILPTASLDLARLKVMNADVWYSAARVTHVKQLPLDRMSTHVLLKDGVLQLAPLDLGVAGGQLKGTLAINANSNPAAVEVRLDASALQLNQLFPTIKLTQGSWGRLNGRIDLKGRGNSAARMLGTSSGDVALMMGQGEISNILLEYMGLDGGEVIKFFLLGDRNVKLLCAAAAFGVKDGRMTSRAILLDTTDTVIHGTGTVSLADETMDIRLKPEPKDVSILSLRSPLHIGGTFAAPTAGPDKAALAGRAGIAVALAFINPLLALAATLETGPGQDADCTAVLKQAAARR